MAYLDLETLDFADPMFLIPSSALRSGAGGIDRAYLSLEKESKDRWAKYRVSRRGLGPRLLTILEELNHSNPRHAA